MNMLNLLFLVDLALTTILIMVVWLMFLGKELNQQRIERTKVLVKLVKEQEELIKNLEGGIVWGLKEIKHPPTNEKKEIDMNNMSEDELTDMVAEKEKMIKMLQKETENLREQIKKESKGSVSKNQILMEGE